jgi:nitrogen fixation protein NifU and related proteins
MDDPLYREIIIEHWQHPHHTGVIQQPDFNAEKTNTTCGDHISVSGTLKDNCINELVYVADGCAISIAAASLLSDFVIMKQVPRILGLLPDDLLKELDLSVSPARLNCALLSFQALISALQKS